MVRVRHKSSVKWWRGYEIYVIVGLFWFMVIGVWLALLVGSRATGTIISGNPIYAVFTLFLGHMEWPGGWATGLVALEAVLLVMLMLPVRKILIGRARRGDKSDLT